MNDAAFVLDGFGPLPCVRPASVAEVSDLVRRSSGTATALYPVGGRTQLDLGCPPTRQGSAVDLTALDQVIDYPARDMTITVQAGIRVAKLQALLAPENQRLPIDVPAAEQATLGGILASNTSGSRRLGYGTLRDYLLGFSAINDDGEEIKAGGRVVKNVAGYDLCKLFVGSLGTLGILTQATLKLRPLPEEQAIILLAATADHLETLLTQIHASRTRPVSLDVVNRLTAKTLTQSAGAPLPDAPWVVLVGFEGSGEAVHWQVQQLVRELGAGAALEARIGSTMHGLGRALVELPALPSARVRFKANLLPGGVSAFCRAVEAIEPAPLVLAHAGSGIVVGQFPHDLTQPQTAAILNLWRDAAAKHQGRVVVTKCPPAWKTTELVWGPPTDDTWLMREVKNRFDPRRLFNPGRFVDGL